MSENDYRLYFFGKHSTQEKVKNARANKTMQVIRSERGGFTLSTGEEEIGVVLLDVMNNKTTFFCFEDEAITNYHAPFQASNIELVVSFSIDVPSVGDSSVREFKRFVDFVEVFEKSCREYCVTKNLHLPAEIIPVGMSGILEYDFFRNVVPNATSIHLVLSIPLAVDGPPLINIQARVSGLDEDSIEFGGYTEVAYAS